MRDILRARLPGRELTREFIYLVEVQKAREAIMHIYFAFAGAPVTSDSGIPRR